MPALSSPHIHLCTRDPLATARYYEKMFGAKIIESAQPDGQRRYDLDMSGLTVYILRVPPEKKMPESPAEPYIGLDHFGFMVKNLDEAVAELKGKGAKFAVEPYEVRPGVRIAYVQAPEYVRVELVERKK